MSGWKNCLEKKMLVIKIPLQSVSDIITNSSSELFCTVKGGKQTLEMIAKVLKGLIDECNTHITFQDIYYCEMNGNVSVEPYVEWWIGHGLEINKEFLRKSVKAWLDDKIGEHNYEIEFID